MLNRIIAALLHQPNQNAGKRIANVKQAQILLRVATQPKKPFLMVVNQIIDNCR